jgi:hypothetical protein
VIRPIETSEAQEATPQPHARRVAESASTGKSFAAVLAKQAGTASDDPRAAAVGRTVTDNSGHIRDEIRAGHRPIQTPDGEAWRPVRGNDRYGHIVSGPRKGMYINLSHGARRGEVFRVEKHDGERVHVYGKGDSEKVVPAAKDSGRVPNHRLHGEAARAAKRPPNETWAAVPGHGGCVDILSGPRNGYYLNTSGNERDGQVFHMIFRHGKEYHVYGKGEDRQVILVRHANNPLVPRSQRKD